MNLHLGTFARDLCLGAFIVRPSLASLRMKTFSGLPSLGGLLQLAVIGDLYTETPSRGLRMKPPPRGLLPSTQFGTIVPTLMPTMLGRNKFLESDGMIYLNLHSLRIRYFLIKAFPFFPKNINNNNIAKI